MDIGGCQPVTGHLLGVEPNTHGIVGTDDVHLAHTGNTAQAGLNVNLRIVGQKGAVERIVVTVERDLLDVRRLSLAYGQTTLHHIAGQSSLDGGGTILHIHHRHVGIGTLPEENADAGTTRIRSRRRHIHHALHTVDGFLKGHHNALLHRLGIGSRIAGHQSDGRRRNLWKLLQRQA